MKNTSSKATPMPRVWTEEDNLAAAAAAPELREAFNEFSAFNYPLEFDDPFVFDDGGSWKAFEELPTSFNNDVLPTEYSDWSEESALYPTPLMESTPAAFTDYQDWPYPMGIPSSMSSLFNDWAGESPFRSVPPPVSTGETTDFQDVSCSMGIPSTPPSVLPDPPLEPSMINPFRYVKIAFAKDIAASFCAAIRDADTRVLDAWPETVPTMQCFFGKVDLGTVDFGGKKSGTVYHVDQFTSILVNYSGDSSQRVKDLYPDLPNIKVWRTILVSSSPPEGDQSEWVLQDLRGFEKPAYMYKKMAFYIFGGEIYFHDDNGGLHAERHKPSPYGKSYITMGPSNREVRHKPEKRPRSASDIEEPVARNKHKLQK